MHNETGKKLTNLNPPPRQQSCKKGLQPWAQFCCKNRGCLQSLQSRQGLQCGLPSEQCSKLSCSSAQKLFCGQRPRN